MFGLRDTFIAQENQIVGFMYGFQWRRHIALDFSCFQQTWHGPSEHQHQAFRSLHRAIERTKFFPEHLCVERFRFICDFVAFIGLMMFTIGIISMAASSNNKDGPQGAGLLSAGIFIGLFALSISRAGPIIECIGLRRLKKKIQEAIQNCNNSDLNRIGYHARFPQKHKKFCFFILCSDCCCKGTDFSRIDILDLQVKLDSEGAIITE